MFNAYWEQLNFELPPLAPGNHWHRIVDTPLPDPDDFTDFETAPTPAPLSIHLRAEKS